MLDSWLMSMMPIIQSLHGWIYWIALLAALVETVVVVGLFLPGSTPLLLLGASSAGARGPSFIGMLIFAVARATLGDNVNYSLGRRYGQRWTRDGLVKIRGHAARIKTTKTRRPTIRLVSRYYEPGFADFHS